MQVRIKLQHPAGFITAVTAKDVFCRIDIQPPFGVATERAVVVISTALMQPQKVGNIGDVIIKPGHIIHPGPTSFLPQPKEDCGKLYLMINRPLEVPGSKEPWLPPGSDCYAPGSWKRNNPGWKGFPPPLHP